VQEVCSALVARLRAAPRTQQELLEIAICLESVKYAKEVWLHDPQLLR